MSTLHKSNGFTLIELIISLTIIIVLAALAIPNYLNYVVRSNRADAKAALLHIAAAQEKFYLQNNTYALNMETLDQGPLSPNEHYEVEITSGDANGFIAIATPKDDSSQADDKDCTSFSINQLGAKTATGPGENPAITCWR